MALLAPPLNNKVNYHMFNVEAGNSIAIEINNPLPLRYVVGLNVVFIDGELKIYPNILDNDYSDRNDAQWQFQKNFMHAEKKDENLMKDYEYRFSVKGYKIVDNGKELIFDKDFNLYSRSYWSYSGYSFGNPQDSAAIKILTQDFILNRGKYIFEVEGKSEKKVFFNEIKTYIGVYPSISLN